MNLHTFVLFSLTEPRAPSLVRNVILRNDLSQSLQYYLLPIWEKVVRYRIRSPESEFEYPIRLP